MTKQYRVIFFLQLHSGATNRHYTAKTAGQSRRPSPSSINLRTKLWLCFVFFALTRKVALNFGNFLLCLFKWGTNFYSEKVIQRAQVLFIPQVRATASVMQENEQLLSPCLFNMPDFFKPHHRNSRRLFRTPYSQLKEIVRLNNVKDSKTVAVKRILHTTEVTFFKLLCFAAKTTPQNSRPAQEYYFMSSLSVY